MLTTMTAALCAQSPGGKSKTALALEVSVWTAQYLRQELGLGWCQVLWSGQPASTSSFQQTESLFLLCPLQSTKELGAV